VEGAILGETVVAHCKVMGHSTLSCAKTAEPVEMPIWMKTCVCPGNHVLDGVQIPKGKGQFLGVVRTIEKH